MSGVFDGGADVEQKWFSTSFAIQLAGRLAETALHNEKCVLCAAPGIIIKCNYDVNSDR